MMPGEPMPTAASPDRIAGHLLDLLGSGRQIPPLGLDKPSGDAVRAAVTARRQARGEVVVGRKIGFTNRTIWPLYGVDRPLWNHVYSTTVRDPAPDVLDIAGFAEPRLEPEIVLHLASAPEPGMDAAALAGCVDWIAHGIEIVQSVFPGWRFTLPDATAAFGLHGALLLGPHRPPQPMDGVRVTLCRDGEPVATGAAADVLGGPIEALAHLVEVIAEEPAAPPLAAGEIISTGTLTDAMPLARGETWSTRFEGIDLPGLRLTIA